MTKENSLTQQPTGSLGYVGLGKMGRAMTRRLLEAGYGLMVWNRTESRARELDGEGVRVAASPAEVAATCDRVLLSLSDDEAVAEVLLGPGGVLEGARPGLLVADTSTVSPETARRHAEAAAARGVRFVEAPVSGNTRVAEEGNLVFLVGGDRADFEALQDLYPILGKASYHLGEVGAGSMMKLVVNGLLACMNEALAEALCLGMKAGLDGHTMIEIISQTSSGAPVVKARGPLMVDGRYTNPLATITTLVKDMTLVLEFARRLGVPMPAAATAAQLYQAQKNRAPDYDYSSVFALLSEMAGLSYPSRISSGSSAETT